MREFQALNPGVSVYHKRPSFFRGLGVASVLTVPIWLVIWKALR